MKMIEGEQRPTGGTKGECGSALINLKKSCCTKKSNGKTTHQENRTKQQKVNHKKHFTKYLITPRKKDIHKKVFWMSGYHEYT